MDPFSLVRPPLSTTTLSFNTIFKADYNTLFKYRYKLKLMADIRRLSTTFKGKTTP